jgi:hypothetical protein
MGMGVGMGCPEVADCGLGGRRGSVGGQREGPRTESPKRVVGEFDYGVTVRLLGLT